MLHIKPIPSPPFSPNEVFSFPLAGPESGIESCSIVFMNVPPGLRGPSLHSHAEDQVYYVLSGQLTVQIGLYVKEALPGTIVLIPRGTAHCQFNSGTEDTRFISFRGPYPERTALTPVNATEVANADELFRPTWSVPIKGSASEAYKGQPYGTLRVVERSNGGGGLRLHAVRVEEGSSVVSHIHPFDQFYVVTKGLFKISLGLKNLEVGPSNFVIVPAGVVHRNWNDGPGLEEHLVIISPEPPPGDRLAVAVTIGEALGEASTSKSSVPSE